MPRSLLFLAFSLVLSAFSLSSAQRFAAIGDWGATLPHRPKIAEAMRQSHEKGSLAFILTLGDNFYPRGEPIQRFVDDLPDVKIHPAFGNHDVPAVEKQKKLFGAERTYYTVRAGDVEIFVLYSEEFTKPQRDWLEAALKASEAPWKIVALHRPLYSSGMHGGSRSLRQAIEPLLTRYRVPLVLAGHDHNYERLEVKDVVHVVSGGGGASIREFRSVVPGSRVRKSLPNYLILEATAEQLTVTALGTANEVLDRVTLKK